MTIFWRVKFNGREQDVIVPAQTVREAIDTAEFETGYPVKSVSYIASCDSDVSDVFAEV